MSPQYGELGPLAAEIGLPIWGTPANFNGFCVLAALLHGSQVVSERQPNCGVQQRAPPMFSRVTITLGIGPHSSFYICHSGARSCGLCARMCH